MIEARKHTLYYMVQNSVSLSDAEKESLYDLVSSGCRSKNKERLYRVIFYYGIHNCHGIYERVSFKNGVADYCAGQSYPDEIRTLRECILDAS